MLRLKLKLEFQAKSLKKKLCQTKFLHLVLNQKFFSFFLSFLCFGHFGEKFLDIYAKFYDIVIFCTLKPIFKIFKK